MYTHTPGLDSPKRRPTSTVDTQRLILGQSLRVAISFLFSNSRRVVEVDRNHSTIYIRIRHWRRWLACRRSSQSRHETLLLDSTPHVRKPLSDVDDVPEKMSYFHWLSCTFFFLCLVRRPKVINTQQKKARLELLGVDVYLTFFPNQFIWFP